MNSRFFSGCGAGLSSADARHGPRPARAGPFGHERFDLTVFAAEVQYRSPGFTREQELQVLAPHGGIAEAVHAFSLSMDSRQVIQFRSR